MQLAIKLIAKHMFFKPKLFHSTIGIGYCEYIVGHSITVDSMFAIVQGVRRESDGNVTTDSDSMKKGKPYILSS